MEVVHRREPDLPEARKVAWLSDRTHPFAIVLVQVDAVTDIPLGHFGHLGVACSGIEEIDNKAAMARMEGILRKEPVQAGELVGNYVFFADPDGNTVELSYGQKVGIEAFLQYDKVNRHGFNRHLGVI